MFRVTLRLFSYTNFYQVKAYENCTNEEVSKKEFEKYCEENVFKYINFWTWTVLFSLNHLGRGENHGVLVAKHSDSSLLLGGGSN